MRLHFDGCRCGGRGWVLRGVAGKDWPEVCSACGGRGALSTVQLARALGVHRRDVWAVATLRAGRKVGVRVLEAISRRFGGMLDG